MEQDHVLQAEGPGGRVRCRCGARCEEWPWEVSSRRCRPQLASTAWLMNWQFLSTVRTASAVVRVNIVQLAGLAFYTSSDNGSQEKAHRENKQESHKAQEKQTQIRIFSGHGKTAREIFAGLKFRNYISSSILSVNLILFTCLLFYLIVLCVILLSVIIHVAS